MSEKEYIERGALLEMMRERIGVLEKQYGCLDRYVKGYIEGAMYVDVAPAADMVEVVRCKDCKYWTPMDDGISWSNHRRTDGRCKALESIHYSERGLTSKDHFCSYGARKEKA